MTRKYKKKYIFFQFPITYHTTLEHTCNFDKDGEKCTNPMLHVVRYKIIYFDYQDISERYTVHCKVLLSEVKD